MHHYTSGAGSVPSSPHWLDRLASHHLTLFGLLLLGVAVIISSAWPGGRTSALLLPLGLLVVNTLAAILRRPTFRRQPALLVFHLALLGIVLLIAAARLTYLTGGVDIRSGEAFSGRLAWEERGPLHRGSIDSLHFRNEGFAIDFAPGGRRRDTYNRISYPAPGGARASAVIGDEHPLELNGYRVYTTAHKGFSAAFSWQPPGEATPSLVLVSFPSYPAEALRQSYEMNLPGATDPVWAGLQLPDNFMPRGTATLFRLPDTHTIVLRSGADRHELHPGQSTRIGANRLQYLGLNTWMGYWIHYDWTRPWLLATMVIAVLSLAWHVLNRMRQSTWQRP